MIGPKYPVETLQELVDAWKGVENALSETTMNLTICSNRFMGVFYKLPGYKRLAKAKQSAYFESISKGRSNNWHKVHGLNLARSRC